MRDCKRILTKDFNDELYKEFYRKHLKPMYKGKITKRFARLTKKLNEAELFDQRNVLNYFKDLRRYEFSKACQIKKALKMRTFRFIIF